MAPVSEKIDERILRLLGLTDVFDLDYDTYLTLIREAIVTGQKRLPPEELALLANERKRIRGKKGRFKPKGQKINAGNIATTKFLKPAVQPISTPLLPAQTGVEAPQTQPADLSPLQGPLESIKKTLSDFFNFRKDASEDERREYEKQQRSKRESGLEGLKKGMGVVTEVAKKFVEPFQGIIDRIWRFILFTLLGKAFTDLMNWFSDEKNQKKIGTLKRFIKDWWPTILGAVVLFLTPFGRFVRSTLRLIGGLAGKLVAQIPKLAGAIKGLSRVLLNPWVAVPAAIAGTAYLANTVTGQQQAAPVQTENKARAQTGEGLGVQGTDTMSDAVPSTGNMGPTTPYGLLQGAARGGSILDLMNGYGGINRSTGQRISGFGPDTQLIAAQPGEIVINKKTVDAIGAEHFLGLNQYYGGSGANQPRFGRLFSSGGMVGGNAKIPSININEQKNIFQGLSTLGNVLRMNNGINLLMPALNMIRNQFSGGGSGGTEYARKYENSNQNLSFINKIFAPISGTLSQSSYSSPTSFSSSYPSSTTQSSGRRIGGAYNPTMMSNFIPFSIPKTLSSDSTKYGGTQVSNQFNYTNTDPQFNFNRSELIKPIGQFFVNNNNVFSNLNEPRSSASNVRISDSKKYPKIKPLRRGYGNEKTITLPPINSSSGSMAGLSTPAGTKVPMFSATSLAGANARVKNAIIYGIEG